jgi:hypothetical protein
LSNLHNCLRLSNDKRFRGGLSARAQFNVPLWPDGRQWCRELRPMSGPSAASAG